MAIEKLDIARHLLQNLGGEDPALISVKVIQAKLNEIIDVVNRLDEQRRSFFYKDGWLYEIHVDGTYKKLKELL